MVEVERLLPEPRRRGWCRGPVSQRWKQSKYQSGNDMFSSGVDVRDSRKEKSRINISFPV